MSPLTKYAVEQSIVDAAAECPNQLACLHDPECGRCQVSPAAGGQVLFIQRECGQPCPYRCPFGDASFTTCPGRKALYSQYGV